MIDEAINSNPPKIKGLVVKTPVDGDKVLDPTFELKDWHQIGVDRF